MILREFIKPFYYDNSLVEIWGMDRDGGIHELYDGRSKTIPEDLLDLEVFDAIPDHDERSFISISVC